jgi:single-stranded-DNA-specific exonuclease
LLDKESLKKKLKNRFCNDKITKLSELPPPNIFTGMAEAVALCKSTIESGQKITIIGDYDVDGVSSSALMKIFFDFLNYPIEIVIPNRFTDGYGLSAKIAQNISSDLVITVDNGIMAHEAANILAQKGTKLIIIDHHTIGETLPKAQSIVHPMMCEPALGTHEVCAATITWYFIAGLKNALKVDFDLKELLPIVAIATIADVMPLVCINRTIVKAGLSQLNASVAPYALALKSCLKGGFTSESIAFQVAPRLNSSGRMSSAMLSYEFLTAKTLSLATQKLEMLTNLNNERRSIELQTLESALAQIDPSSKVAVVYGAGWHEGVLGIVASRIVQSYKKPTIVLSVHGEIAKGSARGIGNVSIFDLINSANEYLIGFGGHKMAAGLTLEASKLEDFSAKVNQSASKLDPKEFEPVESHIGEISLEEIDLDLCEILDSFEPYGRANEKPKFVAIGKRVEKLDLIGKDKNTSKLVLSENGSKVKGVYFGKIENIRAGDRLSFSYHVAKNRWNGTETAEIFVQNILEL